MIKITFLTNTDNKIKRPLPAIVWLPELRDLHEEEAIPHLVTQAVVTRTHTLSGCFLETADQPCPRARPEAWSQSLGTSVLQTQHTNTCVFATFTTHYVSENK